MRIGYSGINLTIEGQYYDSLRVVSLKANHLESATEDNLVRLSRILRFNKDRGLGFFRIHPELIPNAANPRNRFDWAERFAGHLRHIGSFVQEQGMRLTVHPDIYTLVNAEEEQVFENSVRELSYQALLFDLMGLSTDAKIQIHIGTSPTDRAAGVKRFCINFQRLDVSIRRRLALENDNQLYAVADCLAVHRETGVPVVLDALHHSIRNNGETLAEAMAATAATWGPADGPPMVDYSSQMKGKMPGKHNESLEMDDFARFIAQTRAFDFDLMLEFKDREHSAIRAAEALRDDPRTPMLHHQDGREIREKD